MSNPLRIFLKPGERIYVNGAVIRVDRKVSLEFLNNVTFLLESHVMQADQTTTPLRQFYFIVQMMLIAPQEREITLPLLQAQAKALIKTFENRDILASLAEAQSLVEQSRFFEALKVIRGLFKLEQEILSEGAVGSAPVVTQADREVA
jgi:flagellar protein FlbT